jgi:HSP20 family protein
MMTLTKFTHRPAFVSPFNELVNEFLGRDISQFMGHDELKRSMPSVNIVERVGQFELRLLAPGYAKEDLKIEVENDVLIISAEKKTEDMSENDRFTRREFALQAFSRSFRLPEKVNSDGLHAAYVNGVLTVSIPKAEEAKPKVREIGIN